MVGVGKLLKQMQKMKSQMETLQGEIAHTVLDVSSGGGAIKIKIKGTGEFQSIELDPEFLKEGKDFVQETLLAAINEAVQKAKATSEDKMGSLTAGLDLPGGLGGLL